MQRDMIYWILQDITREEKDAPMDDAYPRAVMEMTVTWGDCDIAGIHYYARTFDWFTNARMHLMAVYGVPYIKTFFEQGLSLPVLKAECEFKRMLRPEEKIKVDTVLSELTRTRVKFTYKIYKENGELACEGATYHAFVDSAAGTPINAKKKHPALWEKMMALWPVFERAE